jgi:hypothetical protein
MASKVTDADLPHLRRCVELAEEAVAAGDFPKATPRAIRSSPSPGGRR